MSDQLTNVTTVPADKPEQPINHVFKPDTVFEISLSEMGYFQRILEPYEFMASVLNAAKERAAAAGNSIPVYESDMMRDEKGQMVIKQSFWEKHQPKKKSITLDDVTSPTANN
jgi:hypothetical protein